MEVPYLNLGQDTEEGYVMTPEEKARDRYYLSSRHAMRVGVHDGIKDVVRLGMIAGIAWLVVPLLGLKRGTLLRRLT